MPHEHSNKIFVLHATAPTCFWSLGYEAVLNRLKLVYENQVEIKLATFCVYDDFEEYLKHYEMTFEELVQTTKDAAELMGIPLETKLKRENFPRSVFPATLAVLAAQLQSPEKAARLQRAILRRFNLEFQDVSKDKIIFEAAEEAGLNMSKFKKDFADKEARMKDAQNEGAEFHHLPLAFYNIIVSDGRGRYVNLDHAFDPKVVEEAIDYLSGGKLKKKATTDVVGYLKEHGLASLVEIERVFDLKTDGAKKKLAALEKQGEIEKKMIAGFPHWQIK